MRKTTFPHPFPYLLFMPCLAVLSIGLPASLAQNAPGAEEAKQELPADPKALMLLAAATNGLTGSDSRPWHLKATYKLLDENGSVTDQGTFEEFWASPTKFKRVFTGNAFTQTDYGTDHGLLRSGRKEDVPAPVLEAQHELIEVLPPKQVIDRESFSRQQIDSNGAKLSCLRVTSPQPYPGVVYCFGTDNSSLRVSVYTGLSIQAIHNRILRFGDRFVAGDLKLVRTGKPMLTAHLDSIETLNPSDEPQLAPTADAAPLPRRINISAGVAVGLLQSNPAPAYPADAKAAGISGTVVLGAMIDVKGHISDPQVVSGPAALQQAAMDAVKTWKYRPYILNGEPVDVRTQINVVFTLQQ